MQTFSGKIVIVTGGASGIGKSLCEKLGSAGATVVVADINQEGAEKVAESIPNASSAALDVADKSAFHALIDGTVEKEGRLDYLFNNAGIMVFGEVRDLDDEHWRSVIDINLNGTIYGATHAFKIMARQGFGHIVNVASIAGLTSTPASGPYVAAKHGVVGLSSVLRKEGESLGVKVSVACPGFVKTPIQETFTIVNGDKEKFTTAVRSKFKKMMTSDEAADVVIKGVKKNREFIVFPFLFRFVWWLYRIHPALTAPLERDFLKDFRKARKN